MASRRNKVDVVYYGVDPVFRPLPADQVSAFRADEGCRSDLSCLSARWSHART